MEIQVTKEINDKLDFVSESLGFNKQKIVEMAILFYLDSIGKQRELEQEFEGWDELSNEALIKFEEKL
ncbi:hypothetical protein CMI41_00085 [Candidatus Pacearchaeota archaeon]|nr:hypothetical protein [Candidatus Pacearchaeota archaeon]|tara:strand:+ start:681 stop:884 length:204 start_codon:yes stop_codon:yes gene_type:complete